MLQSFGRKTLYIAGALGLVAGVFVAVQLAASAPADAQRAPLLAATSTLPPAEPGGIVFLDSGGADAPAAHDATTPAGLEARAAAPTEPARAAAEPARGPAPSGTGGFMRIVIMLTLLIGGGVAWYVARRRQQGKGGTASRSLSLVGSVKIAGRWQVALVKVPGKTLVLGATDKGLSLLSELDDDVALENESDDMFAARVGHDDTVAIGPSEPGVGPRTLRARETTDPFGARSATLSSSRAAFRAEDRPAQSGSPTTPPPNPFGSEHFGNLLQQLTQTGASSPPAASRERIKTDEAQALRARLERHQTH